MTWDEAIEMVFAEIRRAEEKHGPFPHDIIHCAAIVAEEAGELVQASIDATYKEWTIEHRERAITEAVHTAAMAIRFLREVPMDGGKPEVVKCL